MIITNILDLDWYKLTMMQFVHRYYPNVRVKYGFTNRTKKFPLARIIDIGELRDELENIRQLTPNASDVEYLSKMSMTLSDGTSRRFFSDAFLRDFSKLHMSDFHLDMDEKGEQFIIEVEGNWFDAILWETLILSTVNELFYKYQYEDDYDSLGRIGILQKHAINRLIEKVKQIKEYPDIHVMEFGTRRRFEKQWQTYVNMYLATEMPRQYMGSSNVSISRLLGTRPKGTHAHEMFMVIAGINSATDEGIVKSFHTFIEQWYELYGPDLSVALTDTFGTDFFFREFGRHAHEWRGLRHDSGDPIMFGHKAIEFYNRLQIDPMTKTIFFSDGLDANEMIRIRNEFAGKIDFSFGVGTNLTNDVGYPTLSIVVKAIEADGNHLVKLSDNLAKAIGDPETVARYKRVHGYTNENIKECLV